MTVKTKLKRNIYIITDRNAHGAFLTQSDRRRILTRCMADLAEGGYKLSHTEGFKQKHIRYLNKFWLSKQLNPSTIKNRNAYLRWLCQQLGKPEMMPTNDELGVPKRKYLTNENKAVDLPVSTSNKINERLEILLNLERHFGLRRKEVLMIQPRVADQGDFIKLKGSWCKNGRPRNVPIHTAEARYWLNQSKLLAPNRTSSLIGEGKTFKSAKNLYDKQVQRAGIKNPHGLRHKFAQERYKILTGWEATANGGPTKRELSASQLKIDAEARMSISEELGHSRVAITNTYLGR